VKFRAADPTVNPLIGRRIWQSPEPFVIIQKLPEASSPGKKIFCKISSCLWKPRKSRRSAHFPQTFLPGWRKMHGRTTQHSPAKEIAQCPCRSTLVCPSSTEMTAALRAIASIGVSIWISALACLAGCGQIFASPRVTHKAGSEQIAFAEMPSCHHAHSSPPSHQKKQDATTVSCCLPDAISQKTAAELKIFVTYEPIPSAKIDIEHKSYAATENFFHPRLRSGRQTILKTHLLRI